MVRKALLLTLLGVGILGFVGWRMLSMGKPRVRDLEGVTITQLDADARVAEIEFVHPKTGRKHTLASDVPVDCEIVVDGLPARLAALRVGDVVDVRGEIRRSLFGVEVTPLRVQVQRAPATTQPGATP